MCSMSKDVQYKHLCESVTSSVQTSRSSSFGTGEHHSKILHDVAYARLQNQLIMKYQRKLLVSKSFYFEFMIYIRKCTTVSILVQIPCQEI